MNKKAYTIIQWTWGLPQTLAGMTLSRIYRGSPKTEYNGASVTLWDRSDGLSLGKYIFVPDGSCDKSETGKTRSFDMLRHEYGHTMQSLVLGPFYLIAVGLPSLIWSRLPYFKKLRMKTGKRYDSILIERSATYIGNMKRKKR